MEVDGVDEVLLVAEAPRRELHPLDLGIDRLSGGVGDLESPRTWKPVSGGRIEIYSDINVIAEHRLAQGRGVMVSDPAHYPGLTERRHPRGPAPPPEGSPAPVELTPGPGVGIGYLAPAVEQRSLSVYEEVADVAAI